MNISIYSHIIVSNWQWECPSATNTIKLHKTLDNCFQTLNNNNNNKSGNL